MNANAYQSANRAYAKLDLETGVLSASPHKLILMLFQGATGSVIRARALMELGDIPGKGNEISRAINIIDNGLRVSLDLQQGGEIAENLAALYEYMCLRLLQANLKNEVQALDEVRHLLDELKTAWESIGGNEAEGKDGAGAANNAANAPARAAVSYGKA